jgi:Flp pilus assembly protein TadD
VPATTPAYDAFKRTRAQPATVPVPSSTLLRALARDLGEHPLAWPRLLARKAGHLLRPVEIPDNVSYDLGRRENRALFWAPFDYPLLLPLALAGLALTRSTTLAVAPLLPLAGAYALSLLVFVPLARLRQPLALVVIVFASAGATELWRRMRARPVLAVAIVAALLVAGVALRPETLLEIRPTDWQMAGGAWENEGHVRLAGGDLASARAAFVQAMVRNPRADRARAALASLDRRLGRTDRAPLASAAAALCEEGSRAAQLGDLEAALRAFERAARQAPRHPRPWHLLANVHFLQGDRGAATRALERAVGLDPYDPLLGGNLAALRGLAGDWTPRASLP